MSATIAQDVARHDPADLPGCICWLRADLGVTLTDGKVSAWTDQSGSGNSVSEAVAGNRPTQSSLGDVSGILFNGATQKLRGAWTGLAAAQAFTMLAVAAKSSATPSTGIVLGLDPAIGSELADGYFLYCVDGSGGPQFPEGWYFRAGDIAGAGGSGGSTYSDARIAVATNTAWHGCLVTYTRSATSLDQDDARAAVPSLARIIPVPPTWLQLGLGWLGGYPWAGLIGELAVYNRILTLSECDALRRYAAQRYAL